MTNTTTTIAIPANAAAAAAFASPKTIFAALRFLINCLLLAIPPIIITTVLILFVVFGVDVPWAARWGNWVLAKGPSVDEVDDFLEDFAWIIDFGYLLVIFLQSRAGMQYRLDVLRVRREMERMWMRAVVVFVFLHYLVEIEIV